MSWIAAAVMTVAIVAAVTASVRMQGRNAVAASRNFFGTLRVYESKGGVLPVRTLMHGRTVHGTQILNPVLKHWATTYYALPTAIGLAFEHHPRRFSPQASERGLRVGVVGLGVGTIAALGKPGDTIRFYEINPDVTDTARNWFSYLKDSYAATEVVMGDARVRLEEEAARGELQAFDVLAVDAFNSDSIPTHLLTLECADLYRRHLKPDGLLLFHTSNKALDLAPVTRAIAAHLGWRSQQFSTELTPGGARVKWVVVSNNGTFMDNPIVGMGKDPGVQSTRMEKWTDDFTSPWRILNF
jgi:hypothetical protein